MLLASLSPLLTFAKLWQVKEWRWDRLREHLSREGWGTQLFGNVRPIVLTVYVMAMFFAEKLHEQLIFTAVLVLAALAAVQMVLRKQKMPVWTQKAKLLCACALVITGLVAIACGLASTHLLLPFIPVFAPLAVMVAWVIFRPIDASLKSRILADAKRVRAAATNLTVIGITGSVGKTTTKEILGHILQPLEPLVTPAHVNTELGVAQWMVRELPRYAALHPEGGILVAEMGAYSKGEIALMSTYVQQTIGIVTSIGTQHLALFGSQQALLEAKSEIITSLPANGHAFLNGDNAVCASIKQKSPCPVTLVGTTATADVRTTDVKETKDGLAFSLHGTTFTVPLHGLHNITNVLLAIAVAQKLGMTAEDIANRLATFTPPARTFSVREDKGVLLLDDTYNGSASSFQAAFEWAKAQAGSPKVLLTSGLIELGRAQKRTEKELGALANEIFDRVIFTQEKAIGSFSRSYSKPIEVLGRSSSPVAAGSLLACVGRMPPSSVSRLLPRD